MRDVRQAPFCWQSVTATGKLRERFAGKERAIAIAIYQSMTEIANERRTDVFQAFRTELASRAGVTVRTLDRYAHAFIEEGLLAKHPVQKGAQNDANGWELLEPGQGGGGAAKDTTPVQPNTPPRAANDTLVQEGVCISTTEELSLDLEEEGTRGSSSTKAIEVTTDSGKQRKFKVGGRVVKPEECDRALELLARFNERNGSKLGAFTDRGEASPHLRPIVQRIREYPETTQQEMLDAIDRNFANPWWAEDGNAKAGSTMVIFSPKVFARALVQPDRPQGKRSFKAERRTAPDEETPW